MKKLEKSANPQLTKSNHIAFIYEKAPVKNHRGQTFN